MASQIGTTFGAFVGSERELYKDDHNNKVAMSLSQVTRYLRFVDIVHGRYVEASKSCAQASRRRLDWGKQRSGTGYLTADEIDQLRHEAELFERLHLEIESFFIFATIALDKIAHVVEDYFWPARGLSLKSHGKWHKSATNFAREKGIQLPDQMPSTMECLQRQVVDHRDKYVTHQRNPRTMFATYGTADDAMRIGTTHLYPRDSDAQAKSPHVDDIVANLDAYVEQLMDLIVSNRAKSRYDVLSG